MPDMKTDRTHPNGDEHSDRAATERRFTVAEAAGVLGLSAEAVRSRIARGTLASAKEGGTVYVLIDADQANDRARPNSDQADTQTGGKTRPNGEQAALVDALRNQIEDLRRRLDTSEEANRENRRIIAGLVQRVPELEAPRNGHETAATEPGREEHRPATDGAQEAPERRSWWRSWFGF